MRCSSLAPYETYGDPYGPTGTSQTVFGFTGEPTDPTTGLVYLRARYYNPTIGQFPSLDPLEGDMGNPLSLNRYGYVQGNVVNLKDPSGMTSLNCEASSINPVLPGFCPGVRLLEQAADACRNNAASDFCTSRFDEFKQFLQQEISASGSSGDLIGEPTLEAILTLVNLSGAGSLDSALDIARQAIQATSPSAPALPLPGTTIGPDDLRRASESIGKTCENLQDLLRRITKSATAATTATKTQQKRPPRGEFIPGTNNIILLGRTIMNGTVTSLADVAIIIDLWMGDPPWTPEPSQPDILYSNGPSVDDGLPHRYRQRESDVNALRPHFNLEAGSYITIFGKARSQFNPVGNLHLYFSN